MRSYIIMQLNDPVALVRGDGSCAIYRPSFMPYNLCLEERANDMDTRLNNINNFYYWCASRVLTMDRKYAKEILNSLGKKQAVTDRDRAEIAISYHALSLTDVFWVREADESIDFNAINLYQHSLSDSFVDVSLRGKNLTAQNATLLDPRDVAGDVGTQGVAPKAWVRRNGAFYLYKNGDIRDVEAEILASRIADCFALDHIRYIPDHYNDIPVSSSRIITSLERSIVAMEYMELHAVNEGYDLHDLILSQDAHNYYMMNIIDYLIGNNDRHWGNWGFWINNKTNRIEGLHPLMDFNRAFTAYDDLEGTICQTTDPRISQRDAAFQAVQAIGLNQIAEPDREWFRDDAIWDMFQARLTLLKNYI